VHDVAAKSVSIRSLNFGRVQVTVT